jgi:hypothetical protein
MPGADVTGQPSFIADELYSTNITQESYVALSGAVLAQNPGRYTLLLLPVSGNPVFDIFVGGSRWQLGRWPGASCRAAGTCQPPVSAAGAPRPRTPAHPPARPLPMPARRPSRALSCSACSCATPASAASSPATS